MCIRDSPNTLPQLKSRHKGKKPQKPPRQKMCIRDRSAASSENPEPNHGCCACDHTHETHEHSVHSDCGCGCGHEHGGEERAISPAELIISILLFAAGIILENFFHMHPQQPGIGRRNGSPDRASLRCRQPADKSELSDWEQNLYGALPIQQQRRQHDRHDNCQRRQSELLL